MDKEEFTPQPVQESVKQDSTETPEAIEAPEKSKGFEDPELTTFKETVESYSRIKTGRAETDLKPQMVQVMRDVLEGNAKRDKKALAGMSDDDVMKTFHGYGFTQDEIHKATMELGSERSRNIGEKGISLATGREEEITEENFRSMKNSDRGMYSNARDLVLLATIDADLRSKGLSKYSKPQGRFNDSPLSSKDDLDALILVKSYNKSHDVIFKNRLVPEWLKAHIAFEEEVTEKSPALEGPQKGEGSPFVSNAERNVDPREKNHQYKTFVDSLEASRLVTINGETHNYGPAMMVVMKDSLVAMYGERSRQRVRDMSEKDVIFNLYRSDIGGESVANLTRQKAGILTRNVGKKGVNLETGKTETISERNFRRMTHSPRNTYISAQELVSLAISSARLQKTETMSEKDREEALEDFVSERQIVGRSGAPEWIRSKAIVTKEQAQIIERERYIREAGRQGDKLWNQYSDTIREEIPESEPNKLDIIMKLQEQKGLFERLTKAFPDVKADLFDTKTAEALNSKERFANWLSRVEKLVPTSEYHDDEEIVTAIKNLKLDLKAPSA